MRFVSCNEISAFFQKFYIAALMFMILSGSLCGIITAHSCSPISDSWMNIPPRDISIVGLLAMSFFPLLAALFSISRAKQQFFFPLCFIQYFLFGYCAWGITIAAGQSGWLLSFLYLFASYLLLPTQVWFMIRCLMAQKEIHFRAVATYLCMVCSVLFLDYCLITPFLNAMVKI